MSKIFVFMLPSYMYRFFKIIIVLALLISSLEAEKTNASNQHYTKTNLHLGVLAKRSDESTLKRWQPLVSYLNRTLKDYHVDIHPVHFDDLPELIKEKKIDFLLTNTMFYVQLENKYGISRISTLKNMGPNHKDVSNYFGGVVFTKKDSKITDIKMIKGQKVAAVNKSSFGGWVMAYELLMENKIDREDIDLKFYDTHDAVVEAVLADKAEVGTVRTDNIERMIAENKLDLSQLSIINSQEYENFPYIVSTKIYPEWPFSKLQHVEEKIATQMMIALVSMPKGSEEALASNIGGWTVPLDYSAVHMLLKRLKIAPYESTGINIYDVFQKYALWIYAFILALFMGFLYHLNVKKINKKLDEMVQERTIDLLVANKKLEELAHIDSLTGIYNRRCFMSKAEQFFTIAKRNKAPLQVLSLDIDYFKNVNDTYGHYTGDVVLKLFCDTVGSLVRESDIFGRVGGEEFVICLQNTHADGAQIFAEKILQTIRDLSYEHEDGDIIKFTVSIGIAEYKAQESIKLLIKESDEALYKAKNSGRDCVFVSC